MKQIVIIVNIYQMNQRNYKIVKIVNIQKKEQMIINNNFKNVKLKLKN